MKKLTAVIPIRQGSQRVPNKNFKNFADSNLLEIKIKQLKNVKLIDNIIVNTDSDVAITIAKKHNVGYYKRESYYASSECSNAEHWKNLAETTDTDYIMHTPCTAPMILSDTYMNCIHSYFNLKSEYDSVNTVKLVKEFMWLGKNPINYDTKKSPNSQLLPDIKALTFGVSIISKDLMLKKSNVVGINPYLYTLDDFESIDIDTLLDFEFAEFLYKKHRL
jgi:CMP-N-acetylneuraminic acid synthetase